MIKKLIPHWYIDEDDNEDSIISDNAHFAISPYLEELNEVNQKSFNNLTGGERVYTEAMMSRVIGLLEDTQTIISQRMQNILPEISKTPLDSNKPYPVADVLWVNYRQQLKSIDELMKIFTL